MFNHTQSESGLVHCCLIDFQGSKGLLATTSTMLNGIGTSHSFDLPYQGGVEHYDSVFARSLNTDLLCVRLNHAGSWDLKVNLIPGKTYLLIAGLNAFVRRSLMSDTFLCEIKSQKETRFGYLVLAEINQESQGASLSVYSKCPYSDTRTGIKIGPNCDDVSKTDLSFTHYSPPVLATKN